MTQDALTNQLGTLADAVRADSRWQQDDLHVQVLGMLLYGLALMTGRNVKIPNVSDIDAAVLRCLTDHVGAAAKWSGGLVAEASASAASKAHDPANHALVEAGQRYYGVDNQKAVVDNVFACIRYARQYAEENDHRFGSARQQASPPESAPAKDVFMIDYAHESDGVFHHGTFSLIGGNVGATWTLDNKGQKKAQDLSMTAETFRSVWESLNDIADFKAGRVTDPNRQLDPSTHHIIGIVFSVDGDKGQRTVMIPSASASPAFREWLKKLGYTGN